MKVIRKVLMKVGQILIKQLGYVSGMSRSVKASVHCIGIESWMHLRQCCPYSDKVISCHLHLSREREYSTTKVQQGYMFVTQSIKELVDGGCV